jgi:uncharacterized membrane protein YeaQ/YmgE (transglycosylase-associated protein family)
MAHMQTLLAEIDVQQILTVAFVGVVAGALARFLVPGKQSMNLILTMVLGIAGAYVGSYLATVTGIGGGGLGWTILLATAGSIVVLFVVMILQKVFGK